MKTCEKLAAMAGYVEQTPTSASTCEGDCFRRIALGKMRASTFERYQFELRELSEFARANQVQLLAAMDRAFIEQYKVWRIERIRKRSKFAGAKSLLLSAAILHRSFGFGSDNEMLAKNPVRLKKQAAF